MRSKPRISIRVVAAVTGAVMLPSACTTLTQTRTEVTTPEAADPRSSESTLAAWLTGSFSTHAQSIANPNFHDLHIEAVACWTNRTDGPWIYLEQSSSSTIDQPYKQRVYQLVENFDGTITMLVFALPDPPLAHALAWKLPNPLNDLTPVLLTPLDGCAITMTIAESGALATGGTEGSTCESSHTGVAYATTELIASGDGLQLWERGYDASGSIVAGSRTGPCVFVRCAPSNALVAQPIREDSTAQK